MRKWSARGKGQHFSTTSRADGSCRRRRVPWRLVTKILGFLTVLFGLFKVSLELWLWMQSGLA
jgi:hypothetical protein